VPGHLHTIDSAARMAGAVPATVRGWIRRAWFRPQQPLRPISVNATGLLMLRILVAAKWALRGSPGARPAWQRLARLLQGLQHLQPDRSPEELRQALIGRALVRFRRQRRWLLLSREEVAARAEQLRHAQRIIRLQDLAA